MCVDIFIFEPTRRDKALNNFSQFLQVPSSLQQSTNSDLASAPTPSEMEKDRVIRSTSSSIQQSSVCTDFQSFDFTQNSVQQIE